jgi:hypothetical protein
MRFRPSGTPSTPNHLAPSPVSAAVPAISELTHLIESSVIDVTSIIDPQIIRSSIHLPFAFAATRRCS